MASAGRQNSTYRWLYTGLTADTASSTAGGTTSHGSASAAGDSRRPARTPAITPPIASSATGAISAFDPARSLASVVSVLVPGLGSQLIWTRWLKALKSNGTSTTTDVAGESSHASTMRRRGT